MRRWLRFAGVVTLVCWGSIVIGRVQAAGINRLNAGKDPKVQANQAICLKAVGVVKQQGKKTLLEFQPEFAPALKGLQDFSHLWVFYWFHENDRPEARATLQVHPRRDPANPLTGVFACRSPERPNLIGLTACRLVKVSGNVVEVADLDARDGSPILDLKPYIPEGDAIAGATTPAWLKRAKPPAD
jgi:tRNA-Thr(GGU) m(6)t(6)A37 methyltransferase TsaA